MGKWHDPRTPVWQGIVKGKLLTIYDQALYEESKRLYPDDPNQDKLQVAKPNTPFVKKKPAARYNWIVKLDKPLTGKTA
jgi:hypothetical protein